jgi:DNA-directed RNA polymerase subunit RPC12/RpoP
MTRVSRLYLCQDCGKHYEVKYDIDADAIEPINKLSGDQCPACEKETEYGNAH